VPMHGAASNCLQDQQIERTLEQSELVISFSSRHST